MHYLICFVIMLALWSHPTSAQQASLDDYWQNKAEWQPYHNLTPANGWSLGGGVGGVQIFEHNNTWYIQYRIQVNDSGCQGRVRSFTQIRKSEDQGKTWSAPVAVVDNQANTAWSCHATDGSIHYDQVNNKWLYLFQCLGQDGTWNGCLAQRPGDSPYGQFSTQGINNPVINNGEIWGQICSQPNSRCPQNTHDEGTFDIFKQDQNTYWISFHGYDGVNGYRGIATTTNFDTYQGMSKAYLTKENSQPWRESWQGGTIGFGAGNILLDHGNYYSFNEAADMNLSCTPGQNWDWGMFRSPDLHNWDPYPLGNPIFYSSKWPNSDGKSLPCLPAYGRLFQAGGTTYLHLVMSDISSAANWQQNDGVHIYKLVHKKNLLENANFWKCNTDNWHSIEDSTSSIKRYTSQTTDGTCSIILTKGDIYQDVALTSNPQHVLTGIKAQSDNQGSITLILHELDATGGLISSSSHHVINPTTQSSLYTQKVTVSQAAHTLRIQVYLTQGTVQIEQLILEEAAAPLPGDLNADGKVDIFDYQRLITGFGNPYTIFDYQKVISNFGR